MKFFERGAIIFKRILKKIYLKIWIKTNSKAGNVHLSIDQAALKKIPFHNSKVWLRPTASDVGRVSEFTSNIYFKNSYIHEILKKTKPTVLIDVGGNIGLSSLSLINEFTSIKKVISIEAEEQNFGVLSANFELWKEAHPDITWIAIHGVATHSEDAKMVTEKSLNDLTGANSASGTFRFSTYVEESASVQSFHNSISINSLIESLEKSENVIVKIDIEGGEEHSFKSNIDWLKRCTFITAEVHDKFHPVMLNSSTNMIRALVDNNFAFVPADDVIHCYNREIIATEN